MVVSLPHNPRPVDAVLTPPMKEVLYHVRQIEDIFETRIDWLLVYICLTSIEAWKRLTEAIPILGRYACRPYVGFRVAWYFSTRFAEIDCGLYKRWRAVGPRGAKHGLYMEARKANATKKTVWEDIDAGKDVRSIQLEIYDRGKLVLVNEPFFFDRFKSQSVWESGGSSVTSGAVIISKKDGYFATMTAGFKQYALTEHTKPPGWPFTTDVKQVMAEFIDREQRILDGTLVLRGPANKRISNVDREQEAKKRRMEFYLRK